MGIKKSGFTLIEVLVVTGLLATIGILAANIFFATLKGGTKAKVVKEVKQNGDFAISTMERMIRNAYQIPSSSCTGASESFIAIVNPDYQTTTFACVWDSVNGVAKIASNGAALTSKKVTLGSSCPGSLSFTCQKPDFVPETVQISFTLSQKGTPDRAEQKAEVSFQTTISPRSHSY